MTLQSKKSLAMSGTDSTDWGNNKLATARASTAHSTMTPSNEQLIRTNHPSLSRLDQMCAVSESDGKWIWVAAPGLTTAGINTHAVGREIQF